MISAAWQLADQTVGMHYASHGALPDSASTYAREPLIGNGLAASAGEPRGHGATGWLETTAAVEPGEEIELRWVIWDGGDHARTSTVLVDGFRWDAKPASEPVTVPVDQPK